MANRRFRSLLPLWALPCLPAALAAQTPIGGTVTGTLAAGIYVTNNSITVPAGQTLTLAAGVIIKFTNGGHDLIVSGTLNANGNAANKVILTAYADDSAGGDTNGNGPSAGGPTAWRGVIFTPGAGGTLNYADIRYGGSGFVSNVHLNSASPTLNHCILRDNYTHGLQLGLSSFPTVADCTFTGNGGYAVDGIPIGALPGFSNNTASGNGSGNCGHVTGGGVSGALTLGPAAMINGAICIDTPVQVPVGATLTIAPGTVVKWMNGGCDMIVDGGLVIPGTGAANVVLTAYADDSAGGDTNSNGPSGGSPTAWRGIIFTAGSTGSLTHADIRYGGAGFVSNVHCNGASPSLSHCTLRNNYTNGMQLAGTSFPTVTNCTFSNNGGYAVDGIPIGALPGFANNSANGNVSNAARVTVGNVSGNLTIPATAMIGGAVSFDTQVVVPLGATLTVQGGTVVKLMNGGIDISVNGTLNATGSAGNPVVFTGFADDSAGGDTNTNGPSSASPTSWRGIIWNGASSTGTLDWTEVRYGGAGFVSNIHCNDGSPTLRNCTVRDNYTHGMNISALARPIVMNCTFSNNGGNAIEGVALAAVPGFTNNTATNNLRNCLHVTDGNVTGALTLGPQSLVTGALMLGTNLDVAAGGVLTVEQGVNFKFDNAYEVNVDGAIRLLGTSYEPVVFTAAADDSIGGDTNSNGPSGGSPTAWRGVTIHAGAAASSLENVLIRYTGSGFVPALTCASPLATLRSVRADSAYDRGLVIGACAGNAVNLVAFACGSYGIHATGGGFNLVHATAANCGTGMRRENAWLGSVVNSISYGNSTNFTNFTSGQVLWSCGGFAGSNGNLNVDPQFVAPAQGDLHLQPTSPVLGQADLLQAFFVVKDHDDNSRILDHALIGLPLPDMGAFERGAWEMSVVGTSRLGGLRTWTVTGQPGFSFYLAGFLSDGVLPVVPYGILLCGSQVGNTVIGLPGSPVPVGQPYSLPVPNDPGIVGLQIGIQTLTVPVTSTSVGNFTRMDRVRVRP